MKYSSLPAHFKKETIDRYPEQNEAHSDSKVWEANGYMRSLSHRLKRRCL